MRPDGGDKRPFARGGEDLSKARYGLDAVALSADGRHLLACQVNEFSCSPLTFTVPAGKRYAFPEVRKLVRSGELATADDLSSDGSRVLVDVGPFDGYDNHRIYEIPFEGGKPRLVSRNAIDADWAR